MSYFRPAGLSEDETDSEDDGFYEKPVRNYNIVPFNSLKKNIENSLQDAILNGNINEVETIIKRDLNNNVNSKLDSGWTPLMHACFHAQENIVDLLLNKEADPNLHADSVTPLMAACSNSSANHETIYNIVCKLLEKDSILNLGDKYGQTPLMRAIGSGRLDVVKRLLQQKVNIEMRDQQGWTAVFSAVHHNQPEILELLITHGARLTEVDKSSRTLMDIAISHDYENIIDIINKHLKTDEDIDDVGTTFFLNNQVRSWHDYYPGIRKDERPNYISEIPHLLYGMNCERLAPIIDNSGMDLRSFLLMDEDDMNKLNIELPYERQRLKHGLRKFHMRNWKLNSVAGLYAHNSQNYSVLDCLTTLGTHLQQIYILEATMEYVLRDYSKIQEQIKFEPGDSPVLLKLRTESKKIIININSIQKEIKNLRRWLTKISKSNPPPADLIQEKPQHNKAIIYISKVVVLCSIGVLVFHAKSFLNNIFQK